MSNNLPLCEFPGILLRKKGLTVSLLWDTAGRFCALAGKVYKLEDKSGSCSCNELITKLRNILGMDV